MGVLVNGVMPNSPASQGGVKEYDIIKKINGKIVTEIKEVQKIIGMLKPGQNLSMEVQRSSQFSKNKYFSFKNELSNKIIYLSLYLAESACPLQAFR